MMNSTSTGRLAPDRTAPQMAGAYPIATPPVSWGAILAGAIAAITFGAMLNALGVAIGAAAVDTVQRDTPTAATMTMSAGLWMALSGAVGLFLGGMIAARLAHTVYRKDALLHGMAVWGVGFLLAIALVGTAVSGGTVAAIRGASGAATTLAGATVAGGAALGSQVDPATLGERLQRQLSAPADAASVPSEQLMAEMADLTTRRVMDGTWRTEDRQRMEQLLAATAGMTTEQAHARLEQAERELTARAAQANESARRTADAAASAVAVASFWAFATMLLGLVAAVAGAYIVARNDENDTEAYRTAQLA